MVNYEPLQTYLLNRAKDGAAITLSCSKIEKILGALLPASAYNHRAWWANQKDTKNRPQARAWINAGYKVSSVEQSKSGCFITFVKVSSKVKESKSIRKLSRPFQILEVIATPNTEEISLGSTKFKIISEIKPERNEQGEICEYRPQNNYIKKKSSKLHRFGKGPFCKFRTPKEVHSAGVYVITTNDDVVYIGECIDLSKRFGSAGYGAIQPRNCFEGGQSTNCKINNEILKASKGGRIIKLWFHQSTGRKKIESKLIRKYKPLWNTPLKL